MSNEQLEKILTGLRGIDMSLGIICVFLFILCINSCAR
jgi:hypothetical protein